MILLFIPEKDIYQMIKVIKMKLKDDNKTEILRAFENILKKINLKLFIILIILKVNSRRKMKN